MIAGISHLGVTVDKMDQTLPYYAENYGYTVLSDAPRQGPVAEKVTGVPGLHTRTVYISISEFTHLELFEFFNPASIWPEPKTGPTAGFESGVIMTAGLAKGSGAEEEPPFAGQPVAAASDPNRLSLRFVKADPAEADGLGSSGAKLLYPTMMVSDMEASLGFYRDVLGLETAAEGEDPNGSLRWVLLRAPLGLCLKLVQPTDAAVKPAEPWHMPSIGYTHACYATRDLDAFHDSLLGKVDFVSEVLDLGVGPHNGGRLVYLNTPEGFVMELIDSPLTKRQIAASEIGLE